ncbi:MAG TPA: TlpA disulfide reductase family protein [Deferrisomatales bacterium]|nr:TlpA disulfide reductase family protein [Deferrisomatales bacterium]
MRLPLRTSPVPRLLPVLLVLCATAAGGGERLCPGDPAPPFAFTDMHTGETRSLDEVARGGPLLVVFLQTACGTCVREMVGLKRLVAEIPGCRVLGVFIDIKPRGLAEYVALYDLPFTFTWDHDSSRADAWGVSLSPTSFLLDREGKVAAVYAGFNLGTEDVLRDDLGRLATRP